MRGLLPIIDIINLKISISVGRLKEGTHQFPSLLAVTLGTCRLIFALPDFKPPNILIEERGNAKVVRHYCILFRLIRVSVDMGSYRHCDRATNSISPTEKPEGTLASLAPKLLPNASTACTQADVHVQAQPSEPD
ncbi:hypothetical protein Pelo_13878 [Pelomyxa schiedti]|nr:hypothetical protein Pelo_13878 [Pelomyxa schiedti]